MANTLGPLNSQIWSRRMSRLLKKALVARAICNTSEAARLTVGDRVNRPYMSDLNVNTYVKGQNVTVQDIASTNEQLVVDQAREVSFYVDKIDTIQNYYDAMAEQTDRATYQLANTIDAAIFAQYTNFLTTPITNANLAGGSGAAGNITATTSNIQAVFTTLRRQMRKGNVPMMGDTFIVLDPDEAEILERQFSAVGFSVADATLKNGFAGNAYGVQVYVSNNLSTGTNVVHSIGGRKGSIDLVVQVEPYVQIDRAELRFGNFVKAMTLFGIKTFKTGAESLFNIRFYRA